MKLWKYVKEFALKIKTNGFLLINYGVGVARNSRKVLRNDVLQILKMVVIPDVVK
jgi:hypothetical protein